MMAALGTVVMLMSYFPYFTYAIPAVTGILAIVVMAQLGRKWAVATYAVTCITVFLFAETEAKLIYIIFFGYYPILKSAIEKIGSRTVQYILKFSVFNGAVLLLYGVFVALFSIPIDDVTGKGTVFLVGLLLVANIAFYLYDIALYRVAQLYSSKIHRHIKKIFRIK